MIEVEGIHMKIVAIEPTPSPNNMKVIVDEVFSEKGQTFEHAFGAPEHIQRLLEIPGVKFVYQVSDFLSIERYPNPSSSAIPPTIRSECN